MKAKRNRANRRAEVRSLKIRSKSHVQTTADSLILGYLPEICLEGPWLEKYGFHPGESVTVIATPHALVIQPEGIEI